MSALVFSSLQACGGGGDPGDCGRVPPCGGDVQGSWAPAGSCYDASNFLALVGDQLGLSCPAGTPPTIASSSSNRALSASFAGDGSYSGSSTWSGAIAFEVPSACHLGTSCGDLDTAIATFVDPSNGFVGATCDGSDACSCAFTFGGTIAEVGTYTTSGTTLSTTTSAGALEDTSYCVSGSRLHLETLVGDQVTSDVVLARQ